MAFISKFIPYIFIYQKYQPTYITRPRLVCCAALRCGSDNNVWMKHHYVFASMLFSREGIVFKRNFWYLLNISNLEFFHHYHKIHTPFSNLHVNETILDEKIVAIQIQIESIVLQLLVVIPTIWSQMHLVFRCLYFKLQFQSAVLLQ